MRQLNRREALGICAGILAVQRIAGQCEAWAQGAGPQNGGRHDFSSIHEMMEKFIVHHRIAGASLGIWHEGRKVIGRGYGLANVEANQPVEPETLFSTASVTKSITGV